MRIIIDGSDGVGKTTYAKKLQEYYNIKSYIHLSGNDPRDFDFYSQLLRKQDVIFDRSFFDESIYSEILGRRSMLSATDEQYLLQYTLKNNILVIFFFNDDPIYEENEEKAKIYGKQRIDDYFRTTAKWFHLCTFNVKKQTFEDLVNIVDSFFKENSV